MSNRRAGRGASVPRLGGGRQGGAPGRPDCPVLNPATAIGPGTEKRSATTSKIPGGCGSGIRCAPLRTARFVFRSRPSLPSPPAKPAPAVSVDSAKDYLDPARGFGPALNVLASRWIMPVENAGGKCSIPAPAGIAFRNERLAMAPNNPVSATARLLARVENGKAPVIGTCFSFRHPRFLFNCSGASSRGL
jgi:hypothetical protein